MCAYAGEFLVRDRIDTGHLPAAHTGSDGSSPWARLAAAGFTNMQTAGENVAAWVAFIGLRGTDN